MMKVGAILFWVICLSLAQSVLAQADSRPPGPGGAGMHQRLTDEQRTERREKMRAMREMLIERQRREQAGVSLPVASLPAVAASEPRPGRQRREGLRRLEPEERQRLRKEMQEAVREVYRR